MTLDRQGAVAVCKFGCQHSFDWLEDDDLCKCMGETAGNVHELATEILRISVIVRRSSGRLEKRERGSFTRNTPDLKRDSRDMSVINWVIREHDVK